MRRQHTMETNSSFYRIGTRAAAFWRRCSYRERQSDMIGKIATLALASFVAGSFTVTPAPAQARTFAQVHAAASSAEVTGEGKITIQGSDTAYTSLAEALAAAKDGAVLEVHGKIVIDACVAVTKSVTLKAAAGGGTISTGEIGRTGTPSKSPEAFSLNVDSGKTLILGGGAAQNELLLDEVNVKVRKGSFVFRDGVRISSTLQTASPGKSAIVEIVSKESKASFEGGIIENTVADYGTSNNNTAVSVRDGATVEKISGGSFMSWGSAWELSGEGTAVKEITGGSFANSPRSGLSVPCFLVEKKASVGKISGGNFRAYTRGALELQSAAHIGEISGGIFQNLYDGEKKPSAGSGAKPYYAGLTLYGREGKSPITVDKISGGTFRGVNGMLAVGNDPNQKVEIKSVTGGSFSSIEGADGSAGIYLTQNSEVGEIGGSVTATGHSVGLWNAGTLKKISGGTFTGTAADGLQNADLSEIYSWAKYFKGHIGEISGGIFKGRQHGFTNAGTADTISGGVFAGGNNAVYCSGKTKKGGLSVIAGGAFYAQKGNTVNLVSALRLEPNLADTNPQSGIGRYYAPKGKAVFNKEALVTYPLFTKEDGTKVSYAMSTAEEGKTDVPGYSGTAFRFLKAPEPAYKTVTFKIDDKILAVVRVERGKTIAADSLTDQSMPANPVKDGYAFKEWNMGKDGTGAVFTGNSAVDKDITVYAVFTKVSANPNLPDSRPGPGAASDMRKYPADRPAPQFSAERRMPRTGAGSFGLLLCAAGSALAGTAALRKTKTARKNG